MIDVIMILVFSLFGGWMGYHMGIEDTQADFQEQCVQVGLYQHKNLSIRCDPLAQKISGKTFYINK